MSADELALDPLYASRFYLAAALFALIGFEMVTRAIRLRRAPSIPTTAANTFIWVVEGLVRGATIGLRLFVFVWVADHSLLDISAGVASGVVAYVLIDFIYYWKHRLFHATELGWALHSTHHSSTELNFLATFRLNWVEAFLSYYFFVPLAWLGFDPLMLLFLIEINDGWQVLCHTELFGRIPFWDKVFNHPDFHRVHHSRDRALADHNYTSTLILWDKMFGTYHAPAREADCGVEGMPPSANPFVLQFGGLRAWLRARRAAPASAPQREE